MSLQYGQKAKELLMQLKRSDWLPAYNVRLPSPKFLHPAFASLHLVLTPVWRGGQDNAVREVLEEVTALHDEIRATIEVEDFNVQDNPAVSCGLMVLHTSLLRNKRCLLAYHNHRLARIKVCARGAHNPRLAPPRLRRCGGTWVASAAAT